MSYIVIAIIAFAIIHIFDIVSIKRVPGAKPVVWITGSSLLIYALVRLMLEPDKLSLPAWTGWLGWALLSASALLLIYSLFINLPFRKTYISTGIGGELVKTGMYSLVRHPGVIWYSLMMVSLTLISRSVLFLIAAPLLIGLDIALVFIQDRIFFVRMFSGYPAYQKETPMILPNRNSFGNFIKDIKRESKIKI